MMRFIIVLVSLVSSFAPVATACPKGHPDGRVCKQVSDGSWRVWKLVADTTSPEGCRAKWVPTVLSCKASERLRQPGR